MDLAQIQAKLLELETLIGTEQEKVSKLLEVANEQEEEITGLTERLEKLQADNAEFEKALGLYAAAFNIVRDADRRAFGDLLPAGEYFGVTVD